MVQRVADQVRQRAAFRHEAVHAQDQRHACHRHFRHHRQGGGQGDEAGTGDAGRALGAEHGDQQQGDLVAQGQFGVGGLGDEQRGQGHVDVGAVQPARSIFSISDGSADSDEEVPSTSSSSAFR
ncbi:hypothetical protein G6F40_015757 [Rhizopus arrhizus]|nr:hypothetical protein G6F40_015757 [Rhizopus arrhizus]